MYILDMIQVYTQIYSNIIKNWELVQFIIENAKSTLVLICEKVI